MTTTRRRRILVFSRYPPIRDGIGAYAVQQVRALRKAGHHVEVCSPEPSAAHHHLDPRGLRGVLALRHLMAGFDQVIIHWHPDFFYHHPTTPTTRLATNAALAAAFRSGPEVTIRLHEVDERWAARSDPSSPATRALFRAAHRVEVHVPGHVRMLVDDFKVPAEQVVLVEHGLDFVPNTRVDQAEARRSLGLPASGHVFLCIGFIQQHKGFDRAARAFAGLGAFGHGLHVVGATRIDDPAVAEHRRELERLEATIDGVHLHLGFVSDEAFDRWIVASDTVVLPYRFIWSSSVVERARLFDRAVIASRVGGLADQLAHDPDAQLVDDDRELAEALRRSVGLTVDDVPLVATGTGRRPVAGWSVEGPVDRTSVMAEVRRRAATSRSWSLSAMSDNTTPARVRTDPDASVALPLRRLDPVPLPPANSARPGVSAVKKVIRRVIAWEVDPLRDQLLQLQLAAIQSAEATDARIEDLRDVDRTDDDGPHDGEVRAAP